MSPVRRPTEISAPIPLQRRPQVALDVVGERLQRRDVDDPHARCRAPRARASERVDPPEEARPASCRSRSGRRSACWRRAAIAAQPPAWAGVGASKDASNQRLVRSLKPSRGSMSHSNLGHPEPIDSTDRLVVLPGRRDAGRDRVCGSRARSSSRRSRSRCHPGRPSCRRGRRPGPCRAGENSCSWSITAWGSSVTQTLAFDRTAARPTLPASRMAAPPGSPLTCGRVLARIREASAPRRPPRSAGGARARARVGRPPQAPSAAPERRRSSALERNRPAPVRVIGRGGLRLPTSGALTPPPNHRPADPGGRASGSRPTAATRSRSARTPPRGFVERDSGRRAAGRRRGSCTGARLPGSAPSSPASRPSDAPSCASRGCGARVPRT